VEIIEAVTPIIFDRKELRPNSGGDGAVRGGDGQIIQFRLDTRQEWLLNVIASRIEEPPRGLGGGGPGRPGIFHINGAPVRDHKKLAMQPDDVVLFETPGGGGYGSADAAPAPARGR
jgi:N-methylhydantoinase B